MKCQLGAAADGGDSLQNGVQPDSIAAVNGVAGVANDDTDTSCQTAGEGCCSSGRCVDADATTCPAV